MSLWIWNLLSNVDGSLTYAYTSQLLSQPSNEFHALLNSLLPFTQGASTLHEHALTLNHELERQKHECEGLQQRLAAEQKATRAMIERVQMQYATGRS